MGKSIGARSILNAAKRYGFYKDPPLETPDNERAPSGLYKNGRLFDPTQPQFQVDPGRLAFGQERMLVTPLQMAMVASGVANHGVVMRPFVVGRVTAPDGTVISRTKPRKYRRAMKTTTAAALNEMMQAVVTGGTGTAAQIPGVPRRGQDRDRRDRRAGHAEHDLVHLVRARGRAALRGRGRPPEPDRHRRDDRRADREGDHAGATGRKVEPLTSMEPWPSRTR